MQFKWNQHTVWQNVSADEPRRCIQESRLANGSHEKRDKRAKRIATKEEHACRWQPMMSEARHQSPRLSETPWREPVLGA